VNHLAHFLLCPDDDEARAGMLIADFSRGADLSNFTPGVELGIRLHRRIDALVDSSSEVIALKPLVDAPLRRYAGILLDVFFDYALIRTWQPSVSGPLPQFTSAIYASLARMQARMPEPARSVAQRMQVHDALMSCASLDGCVRTLNRIATRLKRPVDLAAGITVLEQNEETVVAALHRLQPVLQEEARRFAADWPLWHN
jgi:acyl carrier protein phosphodiesterase